MLSQLTINNFAIVKNLNLQYGNGLTVITGETGTGKSIMIDALALALGGRADADVVRYGEKRADVTATFNCEHNSPAIQWLIDQELDQDGDCILRRTISVEGRSRAYINGRPTTVQSLKELASLLVNIYGQHEHQTLLQKDTQRSLLDHYASQQNLINSLRDSYNYWQQSRQALQDLKERSQHFSERLELLSYQFKELDELALEHGEFDELEKEHQRLTNVDDIQKSTHQALEVLKECDSHNVQQLLNDALRDLNSIANTDEDLENIIGMIESIRLQVEEASYDLGNYQSKLENNPERLLYLDERISQCHQLARKHRVPVIELTDLHAKLQHELSEIDNCEDQIQALIDEEQRCRKNYLQQAQVISKVRRKFAIQLEEAINLRIHELGMSAAALKVQVDSNPEKTTPYGYDQVEFMIATNPGQTPKSLSKIASGGELSRISLAIQAICAEKYATPTMIFDEVDVGIGGATAKVVGNLLRKLGEDVQVVCVTHQAQVASRGHHHFSVRKLTGDNSTHTQVMKLNNDEKVAEIARMLGGDASARESVEHARAMIEA